MIGWRAGKAVVERVSATNKAEFQHVAGLHEVLLDGQHQYGPGTYDQCVQYRDEMSDLVDIKDGLVEIQPWFDTTGWAPMDEVGERRSRRIHPTSHKTPPDLFGPRAMPIAA